MGDMRSISLRRPVALGITSIVLLTGLSLAPVGAAFAEDGVDWTSVQPDELATSEAPVAPDDAPVVPDDAPVVPDEAGEEPSDELGVEPEGDPQPQARSFAEAQAMASTSFNPGNIISDYNFFNSWAMTEGEIQAFLDRSIAGPCENSNCLSVLKMNTPNASWSWGTCAPYSGAANESAARIIYKVQRACGLSAKVILVTLQKEQSLVTRTGPSTEILRKAMGMGCPDTDVCDSQYYGFFNQVYAAARQIVWYTNPDSSMYKSGKFAVGQVRPVQLHPNAACGAPGVKIGNLATAALYHYTPYQPNAAALAAGWGASSDACSSYGNRNFSLYYNKWFGDPTATPSPSSQRLAGIDRYETAAAVSRSSFSGETAVNVVYITTGELFPDALSAAPAAAKEGGPLLLVNPAFVPASTRAEIERLKPSRIVIVGLEGGVSAATAKDLSRYATIERIGGADRYETSRKLAEKKFAGANNAYLATGEDFPDALSASAAAGASKVPVVLVNGFLPAADAATIKTLRTVGVKTVRIAGGPGVMTPALVETVKAQGIGAIRLDGIDRYLTSVRINTEALDRGVFTKPATAYIATGVLFADALSGAAAAGRVGSPLYVSQPNCVSPELRAAITGRSVTAMKLLGGTGALSDKVAYLGC